MTHDDHRDLSGLLRDIADDAAHAPRARSLEDMAATARTHGLAARRRRTAARSLVAAASVAIVAVGGVLVAQNLGGSDGTPPPATNPVLPGACGTTFTPPTGGIDGLDLVLAVDEPPLTATSLADLPHVVAVLHEGAAEKSVTLGSTGFVSYTVVKDGTVVATPGAMPEPYTQVALTAGGEPSSAFGATTPVACSPDGQLPAGTYDVWATLDGFVENETSRPVAVLGGPWQVTIAGQSPTTPGAPAATTLSCGDPTVEITSSTFAGGDETILEITPPDGPLEPGVLVPNAVRADPAFADGSDLTLTGDAIETYLLRDEVVVAAAGTAHRDGQWWTTGGTVTGDPDGFLGDGLRGSVSTADCDGRPLPGGEYTLLVVVRATDTATGESVDLVGMRETVTVGGATGTEQPTSTMLACGDPTAEITSSTEAGGDAVTLTLTGTATRVPAGEVGDGAMKAQIRHAKGSTSWYTGDAAEVYLLRDETVVAASRSRQGSDKWHTGVMPPGILSKYPERDELVADIPTTDCDGTALPDGTYTLLVVVPVTQLDGTTETATEIISVRQDLTIGDGPALPTKDASATFPACGSEVPGFQGDALEISGTPVKATVGLDNAHGGEMTVTNIGDTRLAGSFPGVVGGVLTRNGIVVGQIPDSSNVTPTSGYDLARGASTDLAWNTDLRSCSTGEHVGAGTYEVWATATLTGTDGTKESATGKVATVTVDPERVTD